MKGSSAEADLIVASCREAPRDPQEHARLVSAVREWGRVVDLCRHHRVAGLVLAGLEPAWVPQRLVADLRGIALDDAARLLPLRSALSEILAALEKEGCAVIPLKGAVLGELLYREPILRPYADLDLLVREAGVNRAAEILIARGYRCADAPALAPRRFPEQTYWELRFVSATGLVPVEIHVDPLKVGLRPRGIDSWWQGSTVGRVAGHTARLLRAEDLLLMLGVHLQRHALGLFSWLKDLDLVVRRSRPAVDWDRLVESARLEETAGLLWYPLHCARRLLGTPVPPEVLRALAPPPPARWLLAAVLPIRLLIDRSLTVRRRRVIDAINAGLMGRRVERLAHLL